MKRFTILPILMLTLWSGCSKSGGGVKLHTDTDSVAYVIGLNVGANLLKMDSTLNAAAVCKGIADYFAGRQSMTMEEAQTFYLRYVNYAVPEKIREQERRFLDDGDQTFSLTLAALPLSVLMWVAKLQRPSNHFLAGFG